MYIAGAKEEDRPGEDVGVARCLRANDNFQKDIILV
jgi:hypothetical protein